MFFNNNAIRGKQSSQGLLSMEELNKKEKQKIELKCMVL